MKKDTKDKKEKPGVYYTIYLPQDLVDDIKECAKEISAPPRVLARMLIVEALKARYKK